MVAHALAINPKFLLIRYRFVLLIALASAFVCSIEGKWYPPQYFNAINALVSNVALNSHYRCSLGIRLRQTGQTKLFHEFVMRSSGIGDLLFQIR